MFPVLFRIGPVTVYSHGVFIALSFLIGAWYSAYLARRRGMSGDLIWDLAFWALLGGLIGARAWDVVFAWDYYGKHLTEIVFLWEGGASIQGGLIGGTLAVWAVVRRQGLAPWRLGDVFAPGVLLGQGIGRLTAEVAAGDAYGRPTGFDWGIVYPPGTPAHLAYGSQPLWPAEIFEGIWDLAVVAYLVWLLPRQRRQGTVLLLWPILYSAGRFFLEFLRGDSLMFMGLRVAQLTAVATIVAALAFWPRRPAAAGHPEQGE